MVNIVGTKDAREISICRRGANQHSHVLITKALNPATEVPAKKGGEDDMDYAVLKAIAAMDDVTKAYFLTLDEEPGKAFLAKSIEDQKAEATAAKKKVDDEAAAQKKRDEDAAKAAGDTSAAVELLKSDNAALREEIETMKRDKELDKEASDPGFSGYPGGKDAVVSMLKSIGKVEGEARKAIIDGMKARAALALKTTNELGGRDPEEIAKTQPATVALETAVKQVMTEKGLSREAAMAEMRKTPVHADLINKALQEQGVL